MKIEIEKKDFIKIASIIMVFFFICLMFYIILAYIKLDNEKNAEVNKSKEIINYEIKSSFFEEHKVVPQNAHFLSRVYDGEVSSSDICEKIYKLVFLEMPQIYELKAKSDLELEQYYNENEIQIKEFFEVVNKDEYIKLVKRICALENLSYIDSKYNFDEYNQGETLDSIDLEIEFEKSKIIFTVNLANIKMQDKPDLTFKLK